MPDSSQKVSEKEVTERQPKPERGSILRLKTDTLAFEGKAIARRDDGYVVFVEGALANETVDVEILKAKGSFAESKLVDIITPSPDRRLSICPDFGICGGCSLLHMSYPTQLFWKEQQVRDVFQRIGKIEDPPVLPAIGNETEYHYRNKMEFSFSEERWLTKEEIGTDSAFDRFALGMHVKGRYDRVMDTKECFIAHAATKKAMEVARSFARENDLRVFHPDKCPDGLLRFLVVRNSHHTKEMMVNLVTSHYDEKLIKMFAERIHNEVPETTTVINNINGRRAGVAVGDKEYVITGSGFITDKIGNATYRISANSFFQTNSHQATKLYEVGRAFADLKSDDTLWDLYCGAGTITLFVAPFVKFALGIELAPSAIADAKVNAERNGVSNVDFVASDIRTALVSDEMLSHYPKPDVMMIDPPRSGMHPDVVKEILELAPERISYISCNPATQARDIELLSEKYELLELQPVDMFPQTWHIECVAKLRRR
jgi:23S rRNA (uracil1939-C5)-methyltransferase